MVSSLEENNSTFTVTTRESPLFRISAVIFKIYNVDNVVFFYAEKHYYGESNIIGKSEYLLDVPCYPFG